MCYHAYLSSLYRKICHFFFHGPVLGANEKLWTKPQMIPSMPMWNVKLITEGYAQLLEPVPNDHLACKSKEGPQHVSSHGCHVHCVDVLLLSGRVARLPPDASHFLIALGSSPCTFKKRSFVLVEDYFMTKLDHKISTKHGLQTPYSPVIVVDT